MKKYNDYTDYIKAYLAGEIEFSEVENYLKSLKNEDDEDPNFKDNIYKDIKVIMDIINIRSHILKEKEKETAQRIFEQAEAEAQKFRVLLPKEIKVFSRKGSWNVSYDIDEKGIVLYPVIVIEYNNPDKEMSFSLTKDGHIAYTVGNTDKINYFGKSAWWHRKEHYNEFYNILSKNLGF